MAKFVDGFLISRNLALAPILIPQQGFEGGGQKIGPAGLLQELRDRLAIQNQIDQKEDLLIG